MEFTVMDSGEIQSVQMKDETIKVRLIKLAGDTGQGLGGARFEVLDSKGKTVMKFKTKEEGVTIEGKLKAGETYTFKETEAPKGYQLAKAVTYKVKDTGEVQKISVTDTKVPKPHRPQTDGQTPIVPVAALMIGLAGAGVLHFRRRKVRR